MKYPRGCEPASRLEWWVNTSARLTNLTKSASSVAPCETTQPSGSFRASSIMTVFRLVTALLMFVRCMT